ncbi:MAG: OadG family protein [Oscillospiraceae bacterium]|nr:OadG family protein [Clostridiales bacterium]MDY4995948.1 OadG family protein [Oscillospiraceae bacterium]MCI6528030.1 OadG family protein [Clostridiales bacterium]MCI6807733.1 OadG family protein [Clostridiales bacterium]MCI7133596.1 OadG family protein [Clostridiales bacterium]
MFFVNAALNDISIGTAGLVALLGYAVVFVGLIALMAVVLVMGKIMVAKKAKTAAAAPAPAAPAPAAPAAAPAPKAAPVLAAGTAGECKFYNVGDREAAMLMAIVANKLGKPLNTLRFKSMKEVI